MCREELQNDHPVVEHRKATWVCPSRPSIPRSSASLCSDVNGDESLQRWQSSSVREKSPPCKVGASRSALVRCSCGKSTGTFVYNRSGGIRFRFVFQSVEICPISRRRQLETVRSLRLPPPYKTRIRACRLQVENELLPQPPHHHRITLPAHHRCTRRVQSTHARPPHRTRQRASSTTV